MRISFGIAFGAALLTGAMLLSGCSDTSDLQQLNQNEFTLRGMIASQQAKIDSLQQNVSQLKDQVAEMQHNAPSGGAPSDLDKRLGDMESEIRALQAGQPGMAPPPSNSAPPPGTSASPPPGTLASAPSIPPPPAAAPPPPAMPEPSPTWPGEVDDQLAKTGDSREPGAKIYREGLEAMKNGQYPAAIQKFQKIVHNYPKSPFSAPAEYFQGNALFENGKPLDAIIQFNDVVGRFPNGPFTCQALLQQARAFVKTDDSIDARLTLQKLTSTPNCSAQNEIAKNMLKSLSAY